jgi:ubiquinone/menaquinone biosynthesis C-methylase UbiE
MDARLQRRVQRYGWDRAADHYDASWTDPLRPARERLLEHAALQPGEHVLDLACGTGAVALEAGRRVGPGGAVLGTDLSERMVALARSAAMAAGCGHVRIERADAEDPVEGAGRFDAALCALGLMYVPDPERALHAMAGAVRPGGRVVVAVWGERRRCGWAGVFPIVDARVASEVCPMFFRLGTGDALRSAFDAAGLHRVRVDRFDATIRHRDLDEACDAALIAGPVALAVSRFDADVLRAVREEYAESIRPHRQDDGYAIPAQFVVASGERP